MSKPEIVVGRDQRLTCSCGAVLPDEPLATFGESFLCLSWLCASCESVYRSVYPRHLETWERETVGAQAVTI